MASWFYIFAGLLLLVEAFTPGTFIFICFALACFITGALDQFTSLNLLNLLTIDFVLSLMILFLIRPVLKRIIKIPADLHPDKYGSYPEKLLGKDAMVFKAISKTEMGVVKLLDFDETWLAKSSQEIGLGTSVKIIGMEGNHLIVEGNNNSIT
ncbi:MAG: NfeD family protein [Candidatus Caenarcaniphilales bacterium]|jgi:membrane protein implicated in regulation of membrane protease activity|nr:NfeD family protein [Candidatus Caenarcaniphilales bacterium]